MRPSLGMLVVGVLVALVIAALSVFVVDQRQNAIVFIQKGRAPELVVLR